MPSDIRVAYPYGLDDELATTWASLTARRIPGRWFPVHLHMHTRDRDLM